LNQKNIRQNLNILYYIFAISGLTIASLSPLTPIIVENLQIGYSKISIAFFIGNIFFLLATIIGGKLSDRYDTKKVIFYSTLLMSLGILIFGVHRSYIIFTIALLLIRLGLGSLNVSVAALPSKLSKIKISKIFVILNIYWFAGSAIGPLLVSGAIYLNINTNLLFLFYFLLLLISVIISLKAGFAGSKENKGPVHNKVKYNQRVKFVFIKNPIIIICGIMAFFFIGGVWGFAPSVAVSSIALSAYFLFGLLGAIVVNKFLKIFSDIKLLLGICIIAFISLTVLCFSSNVIVKMIFLFIQAISFAGVYPLITAIPVKEEPRDNSGSILAVVVSIGFLGGIVFQPVYGYIADYIGGGFTSFIALASMGFATIMTMILSITLRKRKIEITNSNTE